MSIQKQMVEQLYGLAEKAQTPDQIRALQQQITRSIQDGAIEAYAGVPLVQDLTGRLQKAIAMQQMAAQPQSQGINQPPIAQEVLAQARGLDRLPSNLPAEEQGYAGGGIVAFASGDLVDDETDDDRQEASLMSLMDAARAKITAGLGSATSRFANALPQSYEAAKAAQPSTPATSSTEGGLSGLFSSAATKYGVPVALLSRIAGSESSGKADAANPRSSAKGLFQFTDKTWAGMGGKPGEQFNAEINTDLGAKYIRQNAEHLKKALGRDPNFHEVYAAHYFGPGVAKMLNKANPKDPIEKGLALFESPKQVKAIMKANPNLRGKTVSQVMDTLQLKTGEGIVPLASGGVIAFKNKGKVESPNDDEEDIDYAGLAALTPAAIEVGKNVARVGSKVPTGALTGVPTAAARTVGSGLASYLGLGETAVPAAAVGYGGYKASQAAARTLARPEMAENRQALQDNSLLGAMSGDTAFASAILDAADAKTNAALKNAPAVDETEKERKRNRFASFQAQNKPFTQDVNALVAKVNAEDKAKADAALKNSQQEEGKVIPQPTEVTDPYLEKYMSMLQKRETEAEKNKEMDAYLALMQAGLGMMGGSSPYAFQNIGQGGAQGVAAYAAAQKQRAAEEAATLAGYGKLYTAKQAADLRRDLAAAGREERMARFDKDQETKVLTQISNRERQIENQVSGTLQKLMGKAFTDASPEDQARIINSAIQKAKADDKTLRDLYTKSGLTPLEAIVTPDYVQSAEDRLKRLRDRGIK